MINHSRVDAVAETLANLGHDGIAAFDQTEPEYGTLEQFFEEYDSPDHVTLLGILAASQDYQLNGDAQRFWRELERTASDYDRLQSTQTVCDLLGDFMEAGVNARLNQQKRDRLLRVFEAGFDDWFVAHHTDVPPIDVWERLADDMNTRPRSKTIVLAMKIYDIATLIREGTYLDFPREIPIPCDLQVERVSRSSGVTTSEETNRVLDAWADVMNATSERLGRDISLLRIDSIIWQAGQIIGEYEPDQAAAQRALVEHFEAVGVETVPARRLAEELTSEMVGVEP